MKWTRAAGLFERSFKTVIGLGMGSFTASFSLRYRFAGFDLARLPLNARKTAQVALATSHC